MVFFKFLTLTCSRSKCNQREKTCLKTPIFQVFHCRLPSWLLTTLRAHYSLVHALWNGSPGNGVRKKGVCKRCQYRRCGVIAKASALAFFVIEVWFRLSFCIVFGGFLRVETEFPYSVNNLPEFRSQGFCAYDVPSRSYMIVSVLFLLPEDPRELLNLLLPQSLIN